METCLDDYALNGLHRTQDQSTSTPRLNASVRFQTIDADMATDAEHSKMLQRVRLAAVDRNRRFRHFMRFYLVLAVVLQVHFLVPNIV